MEQRGLETIITEHRFFEGLAPDFINLVSGCAKNVRFEAGSYLLHEGDEASTFFLIRRGRVTLEIKAPGRQSMRFMTVDEGEIVGVSWLFPPYRWNYDAKSLELVRAIAIDATCLREKCEADNKLGYELMKRFVPALAGRLQATRLQLLDLYGKPA